MSIHAGGKSRPNRAQPRISRVEFLGLMILAAVLIVVSALVMAFGVSKLHTIHGTMDGLVFALWICIFGALMAFGVLMIKRTWARRR